MTAVPSFAFPDADAPQLDDKMDLASSPFRQPDDIDIDLDSVRDPSVTGSINEDMVDDNTLSANAARHLMRDRFDVALPDDNMVDDSHHGNQTDQVDIDYNMDAFEDNRGDEDEDILYEDDEDTGVTLQQNNQAFDFSNDQDPQDYQELDAEGLLDEFEEHPEPQLQPLSDTNESENLAPIRGIMPAQNNSRTSGETTPSQHQRLETSQENLGDETVEKQESLQEQAEQHDDTLEQSRQSGGIGLENPSPGPGSDSRPDGAQQNAQRDEPAAQEPTEVAEAQPEHQVSDKSDESDNVAQDVHPVTLFYLQEEMSLFPPLDGDASSVYFLPDSSLAFEPLDKLLAACREILTGTLDHHDELVLDVPGLGLHICEDSKYAARITLAQVLDVYLQLCHNDEGRETQPLYCHLSSRVSLASQYAYLSSASAEGKTFSEIVAEDLNSPDLEGEDVGAADYYQEQQDKSNQVPSNNESEAVDENLENQTFSASADDSVHAANIDADNQANDDTAAGIDSEAVNASVVSKGVDTIDHADQIEEAHPQEDGEQEYSYEEFEEPDIVHGGQEQYAEDPAASYTGQEHETNSSHTLEGETAAPNPEQGLLTGDFDGVDGTLDEFQDQPDSFFLAEENDLDPEAEFEPLGDKELFTAEYDEGEIKEPNSPLPPVAGEGHSSQDKDASAPTPPMTPPSSKPTKRKVEEEDELFMLDLDTPDAKRRRPS